jgi:hypothetical protein
MGAQDTFGNKENEKLILERDGVNEVNWSEMTSDVVGLVNTLMNSKIT